MRASWPALRAQLVRSTDTLAFHRSFRVMRRADPALARFADPAALFEALHGSGDDPESRNGILRALVLRAQLEPEPATTLLLLALWPGLDGVYRRRVRFFGNDPHELASEISGRAVAAIHGLDLTRVRRIAATVIRNVERDIVRDRRKFAPEVSGFADLETLDPASADRAASVFGLPAEFAPDEVVRRLVHALRPAIGDDAMLVVAIAVLCERQRDAAAALGLGPETGRKRYQRALKRLRVVYDDL